MLLVCAIGLGVVLGCSSAAVTGAATPSGPCPIGDLAQPIEIVTVVRTPDGHTEEVHSGGAIPLIEPPQGGQVVFVGVRARNLDGCGVVITATLRDPCTNDVIGLEARPVDLTASPSGWGEPSAPADIGSFANVPVCPSSAATRGLDGQRYLLEVDVRDRDKRTAHATLEVIPTCAETSLCPKECRGGPAPSTCARSTSSSPATYSVK
jgi:hypothetical protein